MSKSKTTTIEVFGYILEYDKNMIYTINEVEKIIIFCSIEHFEILSILRFDNDSIILEDVWNISYIINENHIKLLQHLDRL